MAQRLIEVLSLESYVVLDDGIVHPALDLSASSLVVTPGGDQEIIYTDRDTGCLPIVTDRVLPVTLEDWGPAASGPPSGAGNEEVLDGRLIRTLIEEVVSVKLRNKT